MMNKQSIARPLDQTSFYKNVFILFAFFSTLTVFGQNSYNDYPTFDGNFHYQPNLRLGDALTELMKKPESSIDLQGVKGSPYYHDRYVFAQVGPDKLSVRYNAHTGDFETSGDKYIIPVEGMMVKTKEHEWFHHGDKWLLALGNDIFLHPVKKYYPGKPAKNSMSHDIAPAFRELYAYYQWDGKTFVEIKKRKAKKLIK